MSSKSTLSISLIYFSMILRSDIAIALLVVMINFSLKIKILLHRV